MVIELKDINYKIGLTNIILEDVGPSQGKIKISDPKMGEYEYFWGSMGGGIEGFISSINQHYFLDKILGYRPPQEFCPKKTFAELRKFIRNELDLPWYKHQEFQKDLREKLSYFQERCSEYKSENYFVEHFFHNIEGRLNFRLIEDKWERERIKNDFKNIEEHWSFIHTKYTKESIWLMNLHKKLVEKIKLKKQF